MKGRCALAELKTSLWNCNFSHIYVEKEALNHEITKKILSHFKNSILIEINSYKEIFSRRCQSFSIQKNSPKLILAVKKENFLYEGAEVCHDFGNSNFYYSSSIMNCIYDCEYCYLRGVYPSSNIVIFVNIEDTLKNVEDILKKHPLYICISYDSDLLALENITGFTAMWVELAKNNPNLKIEIRTKSANFKALENFTPLNNVYIAWTLSPKEVISRFEKNTPSLKCRIESIKEAISKGWKIRLCFDPLLYIDSFEKIYGKFIDYVFESIPKENISDVSIGVFRISKDYFKKMQKEYPSSLLLAYPFECSNEVLSYREKNSEDMINFVYDKVSKYIEKEKIFTLKG